MDPNGWSHFTMDPLLNSKVAVVVGAFRGIGLAITKALGDEGGHVVDARRRPVRRGLYHGRDRP
jgi:NAD(P)-dependent dehydrogenase (short-subunit alcohol dehydrogenase family)